MDERGKKMSEWGILDYRTGEPITFPHNKRPILFEGRYIEARKYFMEMGYKNELIIIVSSNEIYKLLKRLYDKTNQ